MIIITSMQTILLIIGSPKELPVEKSLWVYMGIRIYTLPLLKTQISHLIDLFR